MIITIVANVVVMFAIALQLYRGESTLRKYYWPALLFKVFSGIALGLLYMYYYGEGDTLSYHDDSGRLLALAKSDFSRYVLFLWDEGTYASLLESLKLQQPRAVFLTKIASVFALFTQNNYWLTATWFSLISFYSTWVLVKEIVRVDRDLSSAAIFAFLFFPSFVLWSSGFIKESVAMAMVCLLVTLFMRVCRGVKRPYSLYVLIPFFLWILWKLKYYYLAILLPIMLAELIYRFLFEKRLSDSANAVKAVTWLGIFAGPLLLITTLHPNLGQAAVMDVVVANHDAFVRASDPADVIQYNDLKPETASLLTNIPKAFISGMFRPFIWEGRSIPQIVAGVENLVLLILALATIFDMINGRKRMTNRAGWLIFLYSFLLCVFLALAAPNFGTLSRYRVGFLPFMILILSHKNIVFEWVMQRISTMFERLVP
jgi:hypothetical protein